jgi:glucokinase
MNTCRLVADIGGTHARFAVLDARGVPGSVRILAVADHAGPVEAINAYLDDEMHQAHGRKRCGRPLLSAAALAIAATVGGDSVRLTNGRWTFSRSEIVRRLGLARLVLLNDFTALALSLPFLAADELRQVGGGVPVSLAPRAVLGPGTGLGVSGLFAADGRWLPLAGEGGHVSLAPADAREAAILALAWREMPHVSAERLISGTGLPFLHRLVAEVDAGADQPGGAPDRLPADIVAQALAGDALCRATVDTFCAMLGTLAGNLALTLGAQGGVYIGGGIVPRLGSLLEQSPFRARFEAKGRFAGTLAAIPTYVMLAAAPALRGAATVLNEADSP